MIKIDFDTYLSWVLTDPSILSTDIESYWVDLTKFKILDNIQYCLNDSYYYQYNNHIILIQVREILLHLMLLIQLPHIIVMKMIMAILQ